MNTTTTTKSDASLESLLTFAKRHDWGRFAYVQHGAVWVWDFEASLLVPFDDMRALLAWAGY